MKNEFVAVNGYGLNCKKSKMTVFKIARFSIDVSLTYLE